MAMLLIHLASKALSLAKGNTYEEALTDVKSALQFHIETFGSDVIESDFPLSEVFVTEMSIA